MSRPAYLTDDNAAQPGGANTEQGARYGIILVAAGLTLDDKFMITNTIKLKDVTNNVYYPSFVEGIDDLRLINDEYFFMFSW